MTRFFWKHYLSKAWNPFYRMRVAADLIFNNEITIIARDFIGSATNPNEIPKTNFSEDELKAGDLVFDQENNCWCLQRLVKGKVIAGTFYPNEGQSVKYPIYNY